jgi:hypothetical protein
MIGTITRIDEQFPAPGKWRSNFVPMADVKGDDGRVYQFEREHWMRLGNHVVLSID